MLELKKEFGGGDEELVKMAELKRIKQEEEFVQEFWKTVRKSRVQKRDEWGNQENVDGGRKVLWS